MNNFWGRVFDEHPDAEGVDFISFTSGKICQSNRKEDFNRPICYPKSNWHLWKMVNGVKVYLEDFFTQFEIIPYDDK